MSPNNEQIKPTEFAVIDNSLPGIHSPTVEGSDQKTPRWVTPLLLLLVVVAVFVVVWLPDRINQRSAPTPSAKVVTTPKQPAATSARQIGAETSPWSDAQMAKLRKEAQAILTELLDSQFQLEEIGVQQWATDDFANASATAVAGDALYRERHFIEAKSSYQQSLEELQSLLSRAPKVLAENLLRAREAIDQGNMETAQAALLIAATIEPDNVVLFRLKQRAAVIPQLMSLLAQADEAEQSSDLSQAQGLLQQAADLDPESVQVQSELERVTQAYTTQRFNQAMSDGYAALDKGQFDQAKSALRKAGRLVPGSAVAASALQDVDSAETAQRLSDLQLQSQAYEAKEQWAAAVAAYEQVLQIDATLLFAQDGLQHSGTRLRLDQQLSSVIDHPDRLSEKKIADATAQILRNAATLSPRGPLLQKQLQQLETVLEQANTLIPVTLHSDMATEVTVRKVARLGRFQEHQLSLRPGTYIAVGTRDGYRDVRRTFSVKHDSKPPTVVISCTEQI